MQKKRLGYLLATGILLGIEVLIALFAHDEFIRPYLGDVLVVIVLYTFFRIFVPERMKLLPLYLFFFAAFTELLQRFHLVDALGLGGIPFFRILLGSVFDVRDILCYAAGCLMLGAWEIWSGTK